MSRAKPSRATSLFSHCAEWLVLTYLLIACIQPVLLRHDALTPVPTLNLLDGSWLLDTSYKAAGGIWFGRDVAFTYGPLFQWLSSAPARYIGLSTGAIYATWYTLPFLLIVLATFVTARLLLPEVAAWRRGLLVLLAVVYWSPPDLRVSLCLLAFAIFIRLTAHAARENHGVALPGCASAAICVAAFWLSADTGLYTSAALLLCIVATAVTTGAATRMAVFACVAAIGFGVLVLATNAVLISAWNFRFWRSSLELATGYRWFEPFPMTKADKHLLVVGLVMIAGVFAAAWRLRTDKDAWTRRPSFLLAGFCFAILVTQSALVRSDHGHVLMGLYPMLLFCGVVAVNRFDSRPLSIALPAVVVIATLALSSPYGLFRPADVAGRWQQVVHPLLNCPSDMQEFDRACFPAADAALLHNVSAYVDAHTPPGEPIAVFPYQTAFGFASRRQVAAGVLQSYLVNGDYLTQLELEGLRRPAPQFALYLPDGVISVAVDSIPNFTRSPEVWLYLLQHYRAMASPVTGVVALARDESRESRIGFEEQTVAGPLPSVKIRKRSSWVTLPPLHWPEAGADFVRLRLRLTYPLWWRLRKPSKLTLQISLADGTEKPVEFVIEPNRSRDIWIYPWRDQELGNYFADDPRAWRTGTRPAVTGVKLLISPIDGISVVPSSVNVERIDAVRLVNK
jgi:hypothetical protein